MKAEAEVPALALADIEIHAVTVEVIAQSAEDGTLKADAEMLEAAMTMLYMVVGEEAAVVWAEALADAKAQAGAPSAISVAEPISVNTTAPPAQVPSSIMMCQHYLCTYVNYSIIRL
jgi:predicted nucleic acid-binding protein